MAMRLHITLDDGLVAQLDSRVGRRRRSSFISETIRKALDDERRWDDIEAGLGTLTDQGHQWDAEPARWVTDQRTADASRVG
ncbi:MAG TPA: hypothetical protein VGY30_09250 [Solirubrobacteraceae bacterium]|jgi:metal-responsive CopG/Arc/MetJ family transcriptional regulator|nr:hypothetical protein [Solirubrobacteraceae bacterium]